MPIDADTAERTLTLTRRLDARPVQVWAAWTDPARLPLWWGPRGFTCRTHEIDIRAAGQWRFDMIAPDGTVYANRHRYDRLLPEQEIAYRVDDDGAGQIGFAAVARFDAAQDGTDLTLTMVFDSAKTRAEMLRFGAVEAGHTTLDCLAEEVLGQGALSIPRILAAPRHAVWRAWTDPEALAQWFFPNDVEIVSADFTPETGRSWRTVMQGRDSGRLFPVQGRFDAVEPPERLVFSHGWEDEAGAVPVATRVTVTLADLGKATRLTFLQEGLASDASREGHRDGWTQTLDNLSEYFAP